MFRYVSLNLPNSKVLWPNQHWTLKNVQKYLFLLTIEALSAKEVERALGTRTQRLWGRFLNSWKNLLFRWGTKWNRPFHGRFFRKDRSTVRSITLFLFFTRMMGTSLYHLLYCTIPAPWWNTQPYRWTMNWNSHFNCNVFKCVQMAHTRQVSCCLNRSIGWKILT